MVFKYNYIVVFCGLICICNVVNCADTTRTAVASYWRGTASGSVTFTQTSENDAVLVTGRITGLPKGKHGFHIHEYGDISENCRTAGAHLNPYSNGHGGRESTYRHVGDLGNIEANSLGEAEISFYDTKISLFGFPRNIIGRTVVIHENEDDLGQGDEASMSQQTGNAGRRLACAIIGLAKNEEIRR